MESLSFNTKFSNNSSNKDVLSIFKDVPEKSKSIHQGMSITEISEVVSEKIMTIVRKQFEETKIKFETKGKLTE